MHACMHHYRISLSVVLDNGDTINLADSSKCRTQLSALDTSQLAFVVMALRDRLSQDTRAAAAAAAGSQKQWRRQSSGFDVMSRAGSALALAIAEEGSKTQLHEQIARLGEMLTERDEKIAQLTASLQVGATVV